LTLQLSLAQNYTERLCYKEITETVLGFDSIIGEPLLQRVVHVITGESP